MFMTLSYPFGGGELEANYMCKTCGEKQKEGSAQQKVQP